MIKIFNEFDEYLLRKEAGLINDALAPIRTSGIPGSDLGAMQAEQANADYLRRNRRRILENNPIFSETATENQNSAVNDIMKTIGEDDKNKPMDPILFREVMENKFRNIRTASFHEVLKNSMKKEATGFISKTFDINSGTEEDESRKIKELNTMNAQREFMERAINDEMERKIVKIRSTKDKMEVLKKITAENPDMSRGQYYSVLRGLV